MRRIDRGWSDLVVGIGPNRLATAPPALKAHAALVLLAALMVSDRHRPYSWVGVVVVAIVLWPLLRGSRLIWWVQVIAIVSALDSAYETQTHVSRAGVDLSTFVDAALLGALAVVLAVAGVLLFMPSVRSNLDRTRASAGSAWRTCLVAVATHMHRPECHDAQKLRWNKLGDDTDTADACVPRHFSVPASVERRFCRMTPVRN